MDNQQVSFLSKYPFWMIYPNGDVYSVRQKNPRLLKPYRGRDYLTIVSEFPGDKRRTNYVHRLVAEAFIPNPENKPEVNHKNADKHDNRVENLEWVTRKENVKHLLDKGLRDTSSEGYGRHLSKEKRAELVSFISQNMDKSIKSTAEMFNVSRTCVRYHKKKLQRPVERRRLK